MTAIEFPDVGDLDALLAELPEDAWDKLLAEAVDLDALLAELPEVDWEEFFNALSKALR